jgi:hypothetical protein
MEDLQILYSLQYVGQSTSRRRDLSHLESVSLPKLVMSGNYVERRAMVQCAK